MGEAVRECGSCSACCTVMGVPEIEKDVFEPCEHLCGAGCGIYARRPGSCRAFECQWLRGLLEADGTVDAGLRPDNCGVIFTYQPHTAFGELFEAWEVEPGASGRGKAREILDGLEERFLVVVTTPPFDGGPGADGENAAARRRFVGPPHRVREANDLSRSWGR